MGGFRRPTRSQRTTNEYDDYGNPKDPKPKLDDWGHFQRTVLDRRVRPHSRSRMEQSLVSQFRLNMFAQVIVTKWNVAAMTAASTSRFLAHLASNHTPSFC
jgi:hypothetical protein